MHPATAVVWVISGLQGVYIVHGFDGEKKTVCIVTVTLVRIISVCLFKLSKRGIEALNSLFGISKFSIPSVYITKNLVSDDPLF